MPQIFQVLRCYKCLVFQVHQAKKSNKWECKLCGDKQSVKRHYGIGTAKDCRLHVQKLNSMRGEKDELKYEQIRKNQESDGSDEIDTLEPQKLDGPFRPNHKSKWLNYVEEAKQEANNEPVYIGDAEVVLEIPKKRRKQFNIPCNNKTTVATLSVDHSKVVHSNMKTYKPPCSISSEEEFSISNNITHVNVIQPNISSMEKENSKPNIPPKKLSQQVINKNSKWAEFVEDVEPDLTLSPNTSVLHNDYMFSQCDYSELDNVLDI